MRTFARIDRSLLRQNFENIRQAVGPEVTILAVIKADAYGHGAPEVAQTLSAAGASHFAVACIDEGIELRSAGIAGEIVVLSGFEGGEESTAQHHRLTPVIHSACQLESWQQQAISAQKQLPYHLELDTGMNRLGMDAQSVDRVVQLITEASSLRLEGVATHLASADDFCDPQTGRQQERFTALVKELRERGIRPRYIHQSNSAAIAYRPTMDQDMVRPGLALYGYLIPTNGDAPKARIALRPALEWKTRIHTVREVEAGGRVGYYGRYQAEQPMRVGILPVGYADGLDRRMAEGGEVLVGTARCPIVGLVSMDLTTVDLAQAPNADVGDEVTLIGSQLDAEVMAERCGTIVYEVLCGISKRVPRIYSGSDSGKE